MQLAGISSGHIFPAIHTGQLYVCRECGYQGGFIIEVDSPDEVNKIKEVINTHGKGFEIPAFNFPDKWKWFWKIMLILIVAGLVLEVILICVK